MKTKEFERLKIGDKIYRINYVFGNNRCTEGLELKKVNQSSFRFKRILVKGFGNKVGENTRISKNRLYDQSDNWHFNMSDAINHVIEHSLEHIEELEQEILDIPNNIKAIKKELKSLEKLKSKDVSLG